MQESPEQQSSNDETQTPPPAATNNAPLSVTNPFQAVSEILYKPRAVFDALAVKDNWSWIPFFLIIAVTLAPGYLYFNTVDFEWYADIAAKLAVPDGSPAELDMIRNSMQPNVVQMSTMIFIPIGLIVFSAILGGYYTLFTRNDDKSVHGFTDWYGAMWWIMMPMLVSAIISCIYLALQSPGAEITQAAMAPLSLAFILNVEMTSQWYGLLEALRLDSFWAIALGAICLNSWTNFSMKKSIIVAAIPSTLIWGLTFVFAMS